MFKRISLLALAAFMVSAQISHAERNNDDVKPRYLNVALPAAERANLAETVVPLAVLGFTSAACGVAMIALNNRLLSMTSFAGTVMFSMGAYLMNRSFDAAERSCALAKDVEQVQK